MVDYPLVVLIHGSPGTPRSWRSVQKQLATMAPGAEIVTPAIPDWDQRELLEVLELSCDGLADGIAKQVDVGDRRVLLVGFSAGALLALRLASRLTWDLTGLLMFEPMALPALKLAGLDAEYVATKNGLERYFERLDAGDPDAVSGAMDMWYEPGAYEAMPEGVKAWLREWGPLNVRDGRATLTADWDRSMFERVATPVLATYGTAGPRIWESFARSVCALVPNGVVRPIDGGTHALLDTHAVDVASIIAERLA